jgi:hypothetical protein
MIGVIKDGEGFPLFVIYYGVCMGLGIVVVGLDLKQVLMK